MCLCGCLGGWLGGRLVRIHNAVLFFTLLRMRINTHELKLRDAPFQTLPHVLFPVTSTNLSASNAQLSRSSILCK